MHRGAYLVALAAVALCGRPGSAAAQSVRTFVSGHGADSNACSLAAPCRSFQRAHDMTNAGGEITVLDPAGYGSLTVNKAISIVNDGVGEAGVTVTTPGANGITINAGGSDVVNLRGLTLVGSAVGGDGVQFNGGGALNMQNCTVAGFTGNGIRIAPASAAALSLLDTIALKNGGAGVSVKPTGSGNVSVYLERAGVLGNTGGGIIIDGSAATGAVQATATESLASGNTGAPGFGVSTASGKAATTFTLIRSAASGNNPLAFAAFGVGATMVLAQTTASGNASGYGVFVGGAIKTFGNNRIVDVSPTGSLTPISTQ